MIQAPLYSIIIPWRNRPSLLEALQKNLPYFQAHAVEVIVVNGGGDEAMLSEITAQVDPAVRVIQLAQASFNKCYCLNVGVHYASGQYLFFLDADVVLEGDLLSEALVALEAGHFVTVGKVRESAARAGERKSNLTELAYFIELTDIRQQRVQVETSRMYVNEGCRSAPGLILLALADFLAAGGMNAKLEGWGWEDNDLLARLQLLLQRQWRRCGSAIHLSHGDDVRNLPAGSRQASEHRNFSICLNNYSQGNYLGTYEQDIASYQQVLARP